MVVSDAYVFPGFLIPVLTQLFFPKPPTTFVTCFSRSDCERPKYPGKKSRLKQGSNSQPPGNESDTLTTKPPRRGGVLGFNASRCISDSSGYSLCHVIIFLRTKPGKSSNYHKKKIYFLFLKKNKSCKSFRCDRFARWGFE